MAFPVGWERRIKITIPDAKISGNNTNFPILLTKDNLPSEMTNAGIFSALNGGGDVRFSEDAAGTTRLDLDIATFVTNATPANVDIELYVKRPTLNTGAARDIYGWYKKVGEVQPAVGSSFGRNAVWSDWLAVYHMNQDPSGAAPQMVDSTGNGGDLTSQGSMTSGDIIPSVVGDGISLDGINDFLSSSSSTLDPLGTGDWTLTHWFNSASDNLEVVSSFNGNWIAINRDSSIQSSNVMGGNLSGTFNDSVDRYFGVARSGTDVDTLINGVIQQTNSDSTSQGGQLRIGGLSSGSFPSEVILDEYRIRASYLSESWQATEYANQSDPATFAIAGTPEDVGGGDITGTGALTLGSITFSAAGLREITATGSLTLPNLQLSAVGQRVIPGTGSITLPVISLGGVGVRGINSTGSLILPSLELTGLGIKTSIGSGSVTIPAIILSGTDAAQVARVETTLNDLWAGYLKDRGHSGALNDRLVKAFQFETSTSGKDINTLMQLYFSQQGFVSGALNDRLLDFLKTNYSSFDGATQDRLRAALKTDNFFI